MTRSLRNLSKGFTLIELLVVISIIGLLSSIIFASLNGARLKAEDTATLLALRDLKLAMSSYYLDKGDYPPAADNSDHYYPEDDGGNFLFHQLYNGGYVSSRPAGGGGDIIPAYSGGYSIFAYIHNCDRSKNKCYGPNSTYSELQIQYEEQAFFTRHLAQCGTAPTSTAAIIFKSKQPLSNPNYPPYSSAIFNYHTMCLYPF